MLVRKTYFSNFKIIFFNNYKMKNSIFFLFLMIISCNSGNNSELENRLSQLKTQNKELKQQESNEVIQQSQVRDNIDTQNITKINQYPVNPNSFSTNGYKAISSENYDNTKFAYVLIKTKEPKLTHYAGVNKTDVFGNYSETTSPINFVEWETHNYFTDIVEIKNFSEDKKYRLMDEAESITRNQTEYKNSNFSTQVLMNVSDQNEIQKLMNNKVEIISRKCFAFDSYKQASEHRSEHKE